MLHVGRVDARLSSPDFTGVGSLSYHVRHTFLATLAAARSLADV